MLQKNGNGSRSKWNRSRRAGALDQKFREIPRLLLTARGKGDGLAIAACVSTAAPVGKSPGRARRPAVRPVDVYRSIRTANRDPLVIRTELILPLLLLLAVIKPGTFNLQ
jgi:hypothetical protein